MNETKMLIHRLTTGFQLMCYFKYFLFF